MAKSKRSSSSNKPPKVNQKEKNLPSETENTKKHKTKKAKPSSLLWFLAKTYLSIITWILIINFFPKVTLTSVDQLFDIYKVLLPVVFVVAVYLHFFSDNIRDFLYILVVAAGSFYFLLDIKERILTDFIAVFGLLLEISYFWHPKRVYSMWASLVTFLAIVAFQFQLKNHDFEEHVETMFTKYFKLSADILHYLIVAIGYIAIYVLDTYSQENKKKRKVNYVALVLNNLSFSIVLFAIILFLNADVFAKKHAFYHESIVIACMVVGIIVNHLNFLTRSWVWWILAVIASAFSFVEQTVYVQHIPMEYQHLLKYSVITQYFAVIYLFSIWDNVVVDIGVKVNIAIGLPIVTVLLSGGFVVINSPDLVEDILGCSGLLTPANLFVGSVLIAGLLYLVNKKQSSYFAFPPLSVLVMIAIILVTVSFPSFAKEFPEESKHLLPVYEFINKLIAEQLEKIRV
eukprot:TRINITY_DN2980_c0_g4_i1.p1 TRINITY_DN2980_c0_g4~~TRINITY_DN2980_c0_g4_i1.p1  ORF type:complete len:458 (-),score=68.93 TRINITY_DN2980_c0_g4_i1:72-1445(-)